MSAAEMVMVVSDPLDDEALARMVDGLTDALAAAAASGVISHEEGAQAMFDLVAIGQHIAASLALKGVA